MADKSASTKVEAPKLNETQQRIVDARDKSNWEWVTVPEHDLFGKPHLGVIHNFEKYAPGRHFLDPIIAEQIRTNLANGLTGEMRIMQSQTAPGYLEIMKKINRTPATNVNF